MEGLDITRDGAIFRAEFFKDSALCLRLPKDTINSARLLSYVVF